MAVSASDLKQKEIIVSLESKDPKIVNKALLDIKKLGNSSLLPQLIEIFVSTSNEQVSLGLENIFNQLKESQAIDYLMVALQNSDYKAHHQKFAAAIWESGLDASSHLNSLVEIAMNTDYLTCLDILTIIENIEEGLSENDIENNIAALSEQLQWKKSENDPLLASIIQVLQGDLID
jgi:HEAT repeat protein